MWLKDAQIADGEKSGSGLLPQSRVVQTLRQKPHLPVDGGGAVNPNAAGKRCSRGRRGGAGAPTGFE